MISNRADSWRIFRLANGWGAMVFRPDCEEPAVIKRVAPQGADDGQTNLIDQIADLLYTQEGEAPQAVLRSCDRHSKDLEGPEEVVT